MRGAFKLDLYSNPLQLYSLWKLNKDGELDTFETTTKDDYGYDKSIIIEATFALTAIKVPYQIELNQRVNGKWIVLNIESLYSNQNFLRQIDIKSYKYLYKEKDRKEEMSRADKLLCSLLDEECLAIDHEILRTLSRFAIKINSVSIDKESQRRIKEYLEDIYKGFKSNLKGLGSKLLANSEIGGIASFESHRNSFYKKFIESKGSCKKLPRQEALDISDSTSVKNNLLTAFYLDNRKEIEINNIKCDSSDLDENKAEKLSLFWKYCIEFEINEKLKEESLYNDNIGARLNKNTYEDFNDESINKNDISRKPEEVKNSVDNTIEDIHWVWRNSSNFDLYKNGTNFKSSSIERLGLLKQSKRTYKAKVLYLLFTDCSKKIDKEKRSISIENEKLGNVNSTLTELRKVLRELFEIKDSSINIIVKQKNELKFCFESSLKEIEDKYD